MQNMLSAFASIGLASPEEIQTANQREAESLRQKQESLRPKTVDELAHCQGYGFLDRVEWLIHSIEQEPTEARIIQAQNFAEEYMLNGNAGKKFHGQLHELRLGIITLGQLKEKWPVLFAAKK